MPWFIITYFHEHLITCIPNSIKSLIKPKSMLILLTTIFSRTWKKWLSHSKCRNKNNGASFKSINTMAYRGQDIIFKGLGSRSQNLPRGHMTPHNSGPRQLFDQKSALCPHERDFLPTVIVRHWVSFSHLETESRTGNNYCPHQISKTYSASVVPWKPGQNKTSVC